MSTSSDISSLFKLFGGHSAQYREFSDEKARRAPERRWPGLTWGERAESTSTPSSVAPCSAAVGQDATVSSCSVDWAAESLSSMLAKLAGGERVDRESVQAQRQRPQLAHLKVVAVISAKGGVGKSTVAANLCVAMQRQGKAVLAVELDPQNALCHHLGIEVAPGRDALSGGIALGQDGEAALLDGWQTTPLGVCILPYGSVDEAQRRAFERQLEDEPDWLARRLSEMQLAEGSVVVLDTPPGPSVYLQQALAVANLALVVSLPDAASYTTLPKIDSLISTYAGNRPEFLGAAYVINQVERSRRLSQDITQIMQSILGDRVIGLIHRDPSIAEALAYTRSVLDCDPGSQGCHDLQACSQAVLAKLAATERHEQPA